jgi:hypothetical protein
MINADQDGSGKEVPPKNMIEVNQKGGQTG